jgi:hypothetical protein
LAPATARRQRRAGRPVCGPTIRDKVVIERPAPKAFEASALDGGDDEPQEAGDCTIDAQSLPKVKMPNKDNFVVKFPDKI